MSANTQPFVSAFLAIHRRLYCYAAALLPCPADAEEVYQRTCLILWEQWDDYDAERDFLSWACGIARVQARRYLAERNRQEELLGESAGLIVERVVRDSEPLLDDRVQALRDCLQQLSEKHRNLLERCYGRSHKLNDVAAELRMSPNALYLRLKRLRELLHSCVDGAVLAERTG